MPRKPAIQPPLDADARIRWALQGAAFAWQMKVAGWKALDPSMTEREIRRGALRIAIWDNAWGPPGRKP